MFVSKRFTDRVALVAAAALALACSGSGGGGAGANSDVPPLAKLLAIDVVTTGTDAPAVPVAVAYQLKAIGTYDDGSTADVTASVTWASSDPAVATVSGGLVTPVAVGTADLTATDAASGLTDGVTFTVLAAIAPDDGATKSVAIVPDNATILMGTTLQLQAVATLDDFSTVDLSTFANLVWTSSDETVATVSPTGLVLAAADKVGSTTITVTDPVSQLTATTTVQVTDVLALSYVRLSRGSVIGGGSVQVTGTVYLTANALEPVTVTLSSDKDVVQVPASVVVPAGESHVDFSVTTSAVDHRTRAKISATDGTSTKIARLNVRVAK